MAASYQYQLYQQYQQQPEQPQQQPQHQQSYQQPQQYQQAANGQFGYQQQYQQYQQYSQQQPSQQQPATQQYSPQSYQQQYSNPQYPNQQYPQQQVSHSQFVNPNYAYAGQPTQQYPATYQGSYQDNQGQHAQQTAQPAAQSCFNCGLPGHFAQACPEPKRQIPAGARNPEQYRRHGIAPTKRGGQIVTKFSPQGQVSQGSPSAYTPAYSSGGYPQYPQSHPQVYTPAYTPTTPQSIQSPAQNWPQQGQQYPQHHQGYQQAQNNGYYQASPSQQPAWPASGTPVSGTPYGASSASHASPTQSQFAQLTQTPQSLHGQGWGTPGQSIQHSPSPSQQPESATEKYLPQQTSPEETQPNPLGTKLFSPKSPPQIDEDAELEEDDLNTLDVPDLPPSTANYGEGAVTLICMPVPSNFIVADALFPMDPPAPETGGRCYSKYLRDVREDVFFENIRHSVYWNQQGEDPVFRNIPVDADIIAVDDCRSKVMERRKPQDQLLREGRSESRSAAPFKKDSVEAAASLEQLEKALAQAKADIANREKKQKVKKILQNPTTVQKEQPLKHEETSIKAESLSPSDSATVENYQGYENDTEDVLASLGVTGTAKPVGPPTRLVSQNSSTSIETTSRRDSVSKTER